MMHTRALILTTFSLTLFAACTPTPAPEATLVLNPSGPLSLEAGSAVVPLEATVTGSTAEVNWKLAGAGTLSATKGATVSYTPPASAGFNTPENVLITATLGDTALSKTLTIALKPKAIPATLNIIAPSQPIVFNSDKVFIFNAEKTGSTETVQWSLAGTGDLGSIDPTQGASISYTPPVSGTANKNVTLKAKLGTLEKTVTFDVLLPTPSISPAITTLNAGLEQVFTAGVNNRDNVAGTVWTLEGVGTLGLAADPVLLTATGSSVKYIAPVGADVLTEQTVKLTAKLGNGVKVLEFKVKPTIKALTLTPAKTTLIAGEPAMNIAVARTIIAPNAAIVVAVDPATKGGSLGTVDANTYSYTPPVPADVPTGTSKTVTLSFTAEGVTKTLALTIKPKPALTLAATPSASVNAGTAALTLTATRADLDGAKPITYTVKSVTPALPTGTGNTFTATATPLTTVTYNVPSSVTADTTVVISATTGTAADDATAELTLTIKKP
jgi:hypothetical protein